MESIDSVIRRSEFFLRRKDLLSLGYSDNRITAALASKQIFRVRHGWYSVPDAPEPAIRAVRVGGRLTSVSALESYGLPVPRRPELHVAVPETSSRLLSASDRRRRLPKGDGVRVHWTDRTGRGGSVWRVSIEDALVAVLVDEPRDIAVACCSAVMRHTRWSEARMDAVFERAPERAQPWRVLVSALDDSHGESFMRLGFLDGDIAFEQQSHVRGAGRLDFKVGPHTYVEVDGAQHDPAWTGETPSSYENDHDRDTTVAIGGGCVLRYTYRQLYRDFPRVLAAIRKTVADDRELTARRLRHPCAPPASRKRRRSDPKLPR
jgi:very-short-patch-repair endonuclease